ncbi:MAG: hypothetical protein A3K06_02160 [Candidatus Doudnabacteria bacterium RIFCSPHIGHO2_01_52_17]|uniref:N-acetyltransferase domain-containing protein n=1 Tax=Candidatus Doudnabacteria bacterium RIFCSPHIGHO2_01_52_17 TaxID=1817820 RepID=A0A1F5NBK4_9BACT|nr:MAG: hypothetical protein A3K06_02160 [Candidatus Doudnabacteria bacterium RIFCSPHIGHO2_01_52_17]
MEIKTSVEKEVQAVKIVASGDGRIIGRAFLYVLKNELHKEPFGFLEDVFVEEQYRNGGVGKQIVERAIAEAKKQGCYKLVGNSRFQNEAAHRFYERFGFKKQGYEFRLDF